MTGIERLRALADEMGRGGWQGLGGELRSIAEQIEREQETDDAAPSRRAERTCRIDMPVIDWETGEIDCRCSACGFSADPQDWAETYDYCPRCGAKVVEG